MSREACRYRKGHRPAKSCRNPRLNSPSLTQTMPGCQIGAALDAHLDTVLLELRDLLWIVRKQAHGPDGKAGQHVRGYGVVAFVIAEAKGDIRVDGVEPIDLRRVRANLISKSYSASFLPKSAHASLPRAKTAAATCSLSARYRAALTRDASSAHSRADSRSSCSSAKEMLPASRSISAIVSGSKSCGSRA